MPRVAMQELKDLGAQILMCKGMGEDDARYIADVAVTTEAGGVHTHGVVMFASLAGALGDKYDPAREPAVIKEKGATALIDCEGCVSHLAMRRASDLARAKAREHGIAMIAIRNGSWVGGLGAFVLPLARDGFLVQLWAQSRACKDSAPFGGIDTRLRREGGPRRWSFLGRRLRRELLWRGAQRVGYWWIGVREWWRDVDWRRDWKRGHGKRAGRGVPLSRSAYDCGSGIPGVLAVPVRRRTASYSSAR